MALLAFLGINTVGAESWYDEFEYKFKNPYSSLYDRSKGNITVPAWGEAYTLRGYISMYRAKNDTKWLNYTTIRVDNLINESRDVPDWTDYDSIYEDGYKDWGTSYYTDQYDEFMVHDGHISVPILRFVKLVYNNPTLHDQIAYDGETFKNKADHYLKFIEDNIIAKWYVNWNTSHGSGDGQFLRNWTGDWRQNQPHNMYLAFGTTLLLLHEIAQSPCYVPANPDYSSFYLNQSTEMAQYFKDNLIYNATDDAYLWDYMKNGREEDLSHGNMDIEFVIRSYQLGIVFNDADMNRFANTVLNILWNKNETHPDFRSHVDYMGGYGNDSIITGPGKYNLQQWLWLYEFNPLVGTIINQFYINLYNFTSHSDNLNPDRRIGNSEVYANLAGQETGIFEDDYPQPGVTCGSQAVPPHAVPSQAVPGLSQIGILILFILTMILGVVKISDSNNLK